mmetsp:Transcript_26194/g.78308  ORF Transcript_26194/g.78308 Transcript_26194/m.78308 type:complete len:219 (+) Transcript_26194:1657-2313(+)
MGLSRTPRRPRCRACLLRIMFETSDCNSLDPARQSHRKLWLAWSAECPWWRSETSWSTRAQKPLSRSSCTCCRSTNCSRLEKRASTSVLQLPKVPSRAAALTACSDSWRTLSALACRELSSATLASRSFLALSSACRRILSLTSRDLFSSVSLKTLSADLLDSSSFCLLAFSSLRFLAFSSCSFLAFSSDSFLPPSSASFWAASFGLICRSSPVRALS